MKTMIRLGFVFLALVAFFGFAGFANAAAPSPFVGHWQAVDVDGSDIRLTIGGRATGPFQITSTESYISFCDGKAGIVRGAGWVDETDPYVLEADLTVECFTTGASMDFHAAWVYDPGTDTISSDVTTWHRPGRGREKCVPPPAGLTGWWPGDGDANDLVSGRNGELYGNATTGSGLVDLAFRLDGDSDFVEVPHSSRLDFGPGNFTVDLWVNFNDTAGEQVLAEKWIQGDGYVDGWTLTKLENQALRFAIEGVGGAEADLDSAALAIRPGVWYHFAATRQGTEVTLFMNGMPIAQDSGMGASNLNSASSLKFGHRGDPEDTPGSIDERGFYLNGRMDEVELFVGTALSEEQIMALYAAGSAGKCKGAIESPPSIDLRVNYGHDWVESFYEAGHAVRIAVTESDGMTVKATADLITEPKEFWGGETGFQTRPEDWVPGPPDIQPYDWVFGWVDNGASGQVQLGDIGGTIDLTGDRIEGTIIAPWFSSEVLVECHPWGSPEPVEMKFDAVLPDGMDTYACSWAGEWDIQPYQDVGVGYFGPDGHWVANAFFARNPRIIASEAGDWFWTTDFNPGPLSLSIYGSADEGAELLWQDSREADESGFVSVGYEDHGQDLVPGNYLVVSDGVSEKGLVLEAITMEVFDTANEIMAGTAPAGMEVLVVAGMAEAETQASIIATADPESGAWLADFNLISFDITEEMRPWSFAQILDADGDANEAGAPPPPLNPHFVVFPEWEWFDGLDWPDGALVTITVDGKPDCEVTVESWGGFFNGSFGAGCDVEIGDMVTFAAGEITRTHTVRNLSVTAVDRVEDTVAGTADAHTEVYVWPHATGEQVLATADGMGVWQVDFTDMFDLVPGECGRSEIRDEAGNATAVDWCVPPPPCILVQVTDDWFEGQNFSPNVEQTFEIYETQGGALLLSGTMEADNQGTAFAWIGDQLDLVPGHYVVVSDGVTTKELVLEALTFDLLDVTNGHAEGTAPEPYGRPVWVGIGLADGGWDRLITSDSGGNWAAEFEAAVPVDFTWAAAQVFDVDGDATEVRPVQIVGF